MVGYFGVLNSVGGAILVSIGGFPLLIISGRLYLVVTTNLLFVIFCYLALSSNCSLANDIDKSSANSNVSVAPYLLSLTLLNGIFIVILSLSDLGDSIYIAVNIVLIASDNLPTLLSALYLSSLIRFAPLLDI